MDEIQGLLVKKFEEIRNRTLLVLDQLDTDGLNWRPNESSNSIANLVVHIQGNVNERIGSGILHAEFVRDRDAEFEAMHRTKEQLLEITESTYRIVIGTVQDMSNETRAKTQRVRNQDRTNLDIVMQCATHFSEHLGQMMYIAKLLMNERYVVTTIPKRK